MTQTPANTGSGLSDLARYSTAVVAQLARAYPRQEITRATFDLYVTDLRSIPGDLLGAAVTNLIRSSQWFPTLAEIRHECAELALDLPTETQAVEAVELRAVWARERALGGAESAPPVHPLVLRALSQAGGLRALRASERPGAWRAQFTRAYRELRVAEITQAQADERIGYRQIEPPQ